MSLLVRDRPRPGDRTPAGSSRSEAPLTKIDPRIEARRREVLATRRKRLHRRLVIVAVLLTLLGGSFALTRSAALDIDSIQVSPAPNTSERQLREVIGLHVGDHLVDVDLGAIDVRLRALPWVKDAQVERFWRGSVAVSVTERVPVATIHAGAAGWFLVDADGRALASRSTSPPDLPVVETTVTPVIGEGIVPIERDAIRVAQALTPGLRTRVSAVQIKGDDVIELALKPAGVARLGSADDLAQKVTSLQTVFAQVDLKDLCVLDLRVADAPVLTRGTACA